VKTAMITITVAVSMISAAPESLGAGRSEVSSTAILARHCEDAIPRGDCTGTLNS